MHLLFVKQILTSWAVPPGPEGYGKSSIGTWVAFTMVLIVERSSEGEAHQNKVRGINISKDLLLGEGPFAEVEVQAEYDEDIMPLGSHKVLGQGRGNREKTWTIFSGHARSKRNIPCLFAKVDFHCRKEYTGSISKKGTNWVLAFENSNPECKEVISPLKARSAINRWVDQTDSWCQTSTWYDLNRSHH